MELEQMMARLKSLTHQRSQLSKSDYDGHKVLDADILRLRRAIMITKELKSGVVPSKQPCGASSKEERARQQQPTDNEQFVYEGAHKVVAGMQEVEVAAVVATPAPPAEPDAPKQEIRKFNTVAAAVQAALKGEIPVAAPGRYPQPLQDNPINPDREEANRIVLMKHDLLPKS